jgi:tetratricopeptide (TPR) repeat protein
MNIVKRFIANITTGNQSNSTSDAEITNTASTSIPRAIQNFRLVWLDSNIDEINHAETIDAIKNLREVVTTVQLFKNVDQCMNFITGIKHEKIFMISSGTLGETTIPIVHNIEQISNIYIFCENKTRHEQWASDWPKINGVFTSITPICEKLKLAAQVCDHNCIPISFIKITDLSSNIILDQLDPCFVYTRLLKEILLTIEFLPEDMKDFLKHCREELLIDNSIQLENVDKIEQKYNLYRPIWWYTYDCFLYSTLNRALRTMEVDLIFEMSFFIRDLHQQITELNSEQYVTPKHTAPFIVFRGQGLSKTDFDQLMKTQGGLLSFNSFLLTSRARDVSVQFARRIAATSNLMGMVFIMKIYPSTRSMPFANLHGITAYQKEEEEVLFSINSIFRIGQVKQIDDTNDCLWQVDLTLMTDNDPQLCNLTEHIRNETSPDEDRWNRLCHVLIRLGQYDKAEYMCKRILDRTIHQDGKARIYQMLAMVKYYQGKQTEAIEFYRKTLHIKQETLPADQRQLATSDKKIGSIYESMDEDSKALSFHEKILEIEKKMFPPNHPNLAISYNNIGLIYYKMGEHYKTLFFYEKALEIDKKTFSSNHPDLAVSYDNVGSAYSKMVEYSKALSFHEKALEIRQNSLPPNHPDLASSYRHIGMVSANMGDRSNALLYCERAVKIAEQSLPENHPSLKLYRNNLEYVKKKL